MDCVARRAFADIVGYTPNVATALYRVVDTNTSDVNFVVTGSVFRHRVLAISVVVDDNQALLTFESLDDTLSGARLIKLEVDRFGVRVEYGHSDGGCRNLYSLVTQNLFGFFDHLFLFFGIAVRQKYVYLRNEVVGDRVRELFGLILLAVDECFETV